MNRFSIPILATCLLWTGCFHYVPIEGVPEQGTPVRLGLAQPISIELSDLTANNIVEVRGEIIAAPADRILVSAFGLRSAGDFEFLGRGETVSLPRDAIARLEEKRISPGRTAVASALLVGAGYLVQLGLRSAVGGGEGDGGGQPSK